jgi:hypothetical protein
MRIGRQPRFDLALFQGNGMSSTLTSSVSSRLSGTPDQREGCGERGDRDGLPSPDYSANPAINDQNRSEPSGNPVRPQQPQADPNWNEDASDGSSVTDRSTTNGEPAVPVSDYPYPQALTNSEQFIWCEDHPAAINYANLGERLNRCGDLYRQPTYAGGLLLAPVATNIVPTVINSGSRLAPVIADRLCVRVVKDGKVKSNRIGIHDLNIVLQAEAFLQEFRPVDRVTQAPLYLPDWTLTQPGYNDGGAGHRVLHVGGSCCVERSLDTIDRFLDVMAFASDADHTNAVAAALMVMLYDHFPGGKPLLAVTADKSHAGKETIVTFAAGTKKMTSISYQATDWALERSFVGALRNSPDTVVVDIENARLDNRNRCIASAFIERFVTDAEPLLFSTGTGAPVRRRNDIVVAISSNVGSLSPDLMNRSLPIHLTPTGDVATRESPIGNPKLEYLPHNRERIDAELRGMIERWREAGMPRDTGVRHPFTEWAAIIGGILQASGFEDFLGNYSIRRTVDDPLRRGLGLLGAARPDEWLRSGEWAELAVSLGLVQDVVPKGDRDNESSRQRGIGVVFAAHREETFSAESEDEWVQLRLEKARRRFTLSGQPETRYRFLVLRREPIPEDPIEQPDQTPTRARPISALVNDADIGTSEGVQPQSQ